jgi:Protein of unknown function (DUF3987)
VWPDAPGTWRNVHQWPDSAAKQRAADVFRRLAAIVPEALEAERYDGILQLLRFGPGAQPLFDDWHANLERRLRGGEQ